MICHQFEFKRFCITLPVAMVTPHPEVASTAGSNIWPGARVAHRSLLAQACRRTQARASSWRASPGISTPRASPPVRPAAPGSSPSPRRPRPRPPAPSQQYHCLARAHSRTKHPRGGLSFIRRSQSTQRPQTLARPALRFQRAPSCRRAPRLPASLRPSGPHTPRPGAHQRGNPLKTETEQV